jgi:hypothetical protein
MKDLEQPKSFFFARLEFHNDVSTVCDLQGVQNLKKIIIIAVLKGAGKTTFACDFLPAEAQTLRFFNADLIAAGFAPFSPETASFKAGRLILEEMDECVDAGHSFAFETTLSGLTYLKKIWFGRATYVRGGAGCRVWV